MDNPASNFCKDVEDQDHIIYGVYYNGLPIADSILNTIVSFNTDKKIVVTKDIQFGGITTTAVTYKILLRCWDAINYDQSADYFINIIASDSDKSPTASPQTEKNVFFKVISYDFTVDGTLFTEDKLAWTTLGGATPVKGTDRFEVAPLGTDDSVLTYTITLAFTSGNADPGTYAPIKAYIVFTDAKGQTAKSLVVINPLRKFLILSYILL